MLECVRLLFIRLLHSWGSGTISYDFVVSPIFALTQKAKTTGTVINTSLSNDLNAAANAAVGKDAAVVFVNAMSGELGAFQEVDGDFGDRNDLDLWFKGGSMVSLQFLVFILFSN